MIFLRIFILCGTKVFTKPLITIIQIITDVIVGAVERKGGRFGQEMGFFFLKSETKWAFLSLYSV